jgi:ABC-type branched-subunit amino acid transport system ATPase component
VSFEVPEGQLVAVLGPNGAGKTTTLEILEDSFIGATRLDQLLDDLGAVSIDLPGEAVAQLEGTTELELRFHTTFISETSPWVFGEASLSSG